MCVTNTFFKNLFPSQKYEHIPALQGLKEDDLY